MRDDRTHIYADCHYCDILQKEVDREGFHKVPKETKENANADNTIESKGGPLEGPKCVDEHGHVLPGHTHRPTPLLVLAVGHGEHQTYDGTDHTDSANDGHHKHRPQWVGNRNRFGAIIRRVPSCVERRNDQEGGPRSKHSMNTKWHW